MAEKIQPTQLAEKILQSRTEWFFYGTCARNAQFPDGTHARSSGAELTSGGSNDEIQRYYYHSAIGFDPKIPLLYLATNVLKEIYLLPQTRDIPGASYRALPWVVLAEVPSIHQGASDIVINGYNGQPGSRGSGKYTLIQRFSSSATGDLVKEIKRDPQFFELFYQAAFPKFDSQKDKYTGLYRLIAHTLYLLEPPLLESFSQKHLPTQDNSGNPQKPTIYAQENYDLLTSTLPFDLNPPLGVGTAADFNKTQ